MTTATRKFKPNYKGWLGFVRECPDAQVKSMAGATVQSLRRTARQCAPMVKEIAKKVARERGLS